MRTFYPGQMILPLMLVLCGFVLTMSKLEIIHIAGVWQLWPVTLIAAGLEQLYTWARGGSDGR